MTDFEVVGISLLAVFAGLAILSLIISLFPLIFRAKAPQPAAAAAPAPAPAPAAPQEDEDEMAAIIAAVSQAYEDECIDPLIRNYEGCE